MRPGKLPRGNLGPFPDGGDVMGVKRIGVVGSGIMGAGVAEVAARSGFEVVLRSRTQAGVDAMLGGLDASLARQVKKGRLEEAVATEVRDRVSGVSELAMLAACDLVLESVVEDLAVKQDLFGELDRVCAPGAILATNTSTLPVVELAMVTQRPDRVCGIHFFNPAPAMSLVEVIPAITTSDATLDEARAFVVTCGKTAVTVKDQAGFVVNALLFPYLNNAVRLYDAGVASRDDIDAAMKGGCNFPMGPLELLDLVGLDTSLAILDALYAEFHDPNFAPAPLLRRMVAAERLGRKSGTGFYDYAR
jgi:3-hydroxybutyryl-CoA dehydrogenase